MARNVKKIDRVRYEELASADTAAYSDGDIEDVFLELFSAPKAEAKRQQILADNPSWIETYHLSYARENLFNWYPFSGRERLLEIGAGCGALTGLFAARCKHVTALELTSRRALITAHRHHQHANLEVLAGNLLSYKPKEKFDIATSVGVMEYAPSYIEAEDPVGRFLDIVGSLLQKNGLFFLAIENRLGLKYWAGATEDHTGTMFEGIHGYPNAENVVTFGKQQLKDKLNAHGFKEATFYYPHPDYKLPSIIYSDAYEPGKHTSFPIELLPAPATDRPRDSYFAEPFTTNSLEANKLFGDFANSFLVVAKKASA